jgi:hypothetical protein
VIGRYHRAGDRSASRIASSPNVGAASKRAMEKAIKDLLKQLDWSRRDLSAPPLSYLDMALAESLANRPTIQIEFKMPAGRVFRETAEGLVAIEKRTRLAAILAFGPKDLILAKENAEKLLERARDLPLRLIALRMESPVRVIVEIPDEQLREGVDVSIRAGKPSKAPSPPRERARRIRERRIRRFIKAMFHLFAATEIAFTLNVGGSESPQTPLTPVPKVSAAITSMARRACGQLPPGTEFEIKAGGISVKGKCPPREDDTGGV